jgi:hypothetical protein
MRTLDLLTSLADYVALIKAIKDKALADSSLKKDSDEIFITSISLRYDFIILKMDRGKRLLSSSRYMLSRYMECTYRLDQDKVSFATFYCQDKERETTVKKYLIDNTPRSWTPGKKKNAFSQDVVQYLAIADDIAQSAHHCTAGDNYSPGYYSEILLEENRIVLRQINRFNSRSLDHRDDYHMRDLEFFIPIQPTEEKTSSYDFRIGDMFINFSDMSSKNNKSCGEQIRMKIAEHKGIPSAGLV